MLEMIPTPKHNTSVIDVTETDAPDLAKLSPIRLSREPLGLEIEMVRGIENFGHTLTGAIRPESGMRRQFRW
jgi:hypothetical protein